MSKLLTGSVRSHDLNYLASCFGGALLFVLPLCFGVDGLWWVMPVTEFCTAAFAVLLMIRTRCAQGKRKKELAK